MKKSLLKIATRFMCILLALSMSISLFACEEGGSASDHSGSGKGSDRKARDSYDSSDSQESSAPQDLSDSEDDDSEGDDSQYAFEDNVYEADLCDYVVRSYLNAGSESEEYAIMHANAGDTHDSQSVVSIELKNGKAPITLRYADNKEMENAKQKKSTTRKFSLSDNFYPDRTYYYEATDSSGIVERGTIKPENSSVRIINASGGRNIRDAGGWTTQSGDTVKYGLLYRGAQLNGRNGGPKLDEKGINTFRNDLNVVTELDLRGTSDDGGQTGCFFDEDGNYVKISISQYDLALKNSKTQLKQIFDVLSDENNYPLYYHCNAGADRTGTIAFLVGGLLGISESDLTKDFELTSFGGQGKRLRGMDTGSGYSADGIMQNDSNNYVAWGPMVNYIKNNYIKGDVTDLSGGIEAYLLDIGVKQNDLNKIKALLLGLSEDKTDPMAKEATAEEGGIKVYTLKNGEKFTVETDALGESAELESETENGSSSSGKIEESGFAVSADSDAYSPISTGGEIAIRVFGKDADEKIVKSENRLRNIPVRPSVRLSDG